jgi:hypothetical protein
VNTKPQVDTAFFIQVETELQYALQQAPDFGAITLSITLRDHVPQRYTIETSKSVMVLNSSVHGEIGTG